MFRYILFDKASGKIESLTTTSQFIGDEVQDSPFPHLSMMPVEIENIDEWYVQNDRLVARPELAISQNKAELLADGVDEMILSGFPIPCELTVNGQAITLTEGRLTLSADTPATYRIECSQWPWRDWIGLIVAKEVAR